MTSPQQPEQQTPPPPPPEESNAEEIALIAGLLAAAGSVGAGFAAAEVARAGIVSALRRVGISHRQAMRLVELDAARPAPPIIPLSPAVHDVAKDGPSYRARYLVKAAKRLGKATGETVAQTGKAIAGTAAGATVTPLEPLVKALVKEKTYFNQHLTAQAKRQQAAVNIDGATNTYGPILGWYSQHDERVTPECRKADGHNFDPAHPPIIGLPGLGPHIGCVTADTTVVSPRVLAATSRWYVGDLVEITTAHGNHLSITPNHPVLTDRGWIAAGEIDEGSHIVGTGLGQSSAVLTDPHNDQQPSAIADIAGTLLRNGGVVTPAMPVAPEDLHGDGLGSEVDVVWADGVLRNRLDPAQSQPGGIEQLGCVGGRPAVAGSGSADEFVLADDAPSGGFVGGLRIARALLRAAGCDHDAVGLGVGPAGHASPVEHSADAGPRGPVALRERVLTGSRPVSGDDLITRKLAAHLLSGSVAASESQPVGLSLSSQRAALGQSGAQDSASDVELVGDRIDAAVGGLIFLDRVVKVRRRSSWSGHVYNLETVGGWYSANNLIVHNCRCYAGPPIQGAAMVDDVLAPADLDHGHHKPAVIAASRKEDQVSIELSAKTAAYAVVHRKLGRPGGPGLWGHKDMQLPAYVQNVAHGILRTGITKSRAIAIAIGKIRDWAEGKGDVSPEVRAASVKAIAEWEALRAKARASRAARNLSRAAAPSPVGGEVFPPAIELAAINGHHVPGT